MKENYCFTWFPIGVNKALFLPKMAIPFLIIGILKCIPAFAQRPDIYVVSPSRLNEIQTLVTENGTPHYEAFQAMKNRIDPGDPLAVAGTYPNYKRVFYAKEAAFLYLITGDGQYADKAYSALRDVYDSTNPADTRRPDNGSGLNRAQTLSNFAIAYNWAYDGLTQSERDWIFSKIESGLSGYGEALGHPNIGSPFASNWNGVISGAHLTTLIAAGLFEDRLVSYQSSRNILISHINTLGDAGWNQEGEHYLGLSMENVLPAVLAMNNIGDDKAMDALSGHALHHLASYICQLGAEQHSLTWGVGTGYLPATGMTSALLGLIPVADLPSYVWFYDHYRGKDNPAAPAEKYDHEQGGTAFMLIYYPEDITPVNPAEAYPKVLVDTNGGYVVRQRWQDEDDVIINLWADAASFSSAWDAGDALHMNIFGFGAKWGAGPGTATDPVATTLSSLHVNGQAAGTGKSGNLVSHEVGQSGAYVVVNGGSAYSSLGINSIERHLLSDFSSSTTAVFSTADIISSTQTHTYSWNFTLPTHTITDSTENGIPWYKATDNASGSWMKVWCLSPGATVAKDASSARFNVSGSNVDTWVIGQIGGSTTTPSMINISGSGLSATATVGGRTLSFNATTKRLISNSLTDLSPLPQFNISASNTSGVGPLNVNFTATATNGSGLSYAWDFGDGATAAGSSSSHTFSANGTYLVSLVASSSIGVVGRKSIAVHVGNRTPTASFTVSNSIVLPGKSVSFNAASSSDPEGDSLSYEWDFGDGITATGMTTSHFWDTEKTYTVVLKVSDASGNVHASSSTIRVENQKPIASFNANSAGGVAPVIVSFDASNSSDPEGETITYEWNFLDGTSVQTTSNPVITHTFTTPGSYDVSLKVRDTAGQTGSNSMDDNLIVLSPSDKINPVVPVAGTFGTGLNYAVYNLPSTGGDVPDFTLVSVINDGRVATFDPNVSPINQFFSIRYTGYLKVDTAGVYIFKQNSMDYSYFHIGSRIVIDKAGKLRGSETGLVYLEAGYHPIDVGYAYDDSGDFGSDVPFITLQWRKGTEADFTEIPAGNLYSDFAVFYPTFDVSSSQGHDGTTFMFEATMVSPDGLPLTYFWDFGDGSSSTAKRVAHPYSLPANKDQAPYSVRLTITDSSGVSYTTGKVLLVSKFAWTVGKQTQNRNGFESYSRNFQSSYPIDRRNSATAGQFGNAINKAVEKGTQVSVDSSLNSFTGEIYLNDGVYDSRWISENWQGWVGFTFQKDGVLQPYNITEYAFTLSYLHWVWPSDPHEWDIYGSNVASPTPFSMTAGAANSDWTLINKVTDQEYFNYDPNSNDPNGPRTEVSSLTYYWTLPNAQSFSHYVFHIKNFGELMDDYIRLGEIQLFDYMNTGASGNTAPSINLVTTKTNSEAPLTVDFDASGTTDGNHDSLYYAWDFGDGHTVRIAEDNDMVSHVYRQPGNYTATLTVKDGHGSTSTNQLNVIVQNPTPNQVPQASFTASSTNIETGETITFDATGSFDADNETIHCYWEFGDGQKAEGFNLSHTFLRNGVYNVLAKVVDERGGSGLSDMLITVKHPNEGRPVFSVNFSDNPRDELTSAVGAGIVSVGFWNREGRDSENQTLNSYGQPTGITIERNSKSGYNGNIPVDRFDGNSVIMRSGLGSIASWNIYVSNIPYALYDVYVYYGGNDSSTETSSFTIGSQTYYMLDNDRNWDGTYNRSTAVTPGTAVIGDDYVVFQGISLADLDIQMNSGRTSVSALQIVDLGGGPLARDDEIRTVLNTPINIDALANDIGDGLSIQSVSTPPVGSATIVSGTIRYVPQTSYEGFVTFAYTLVDFEGTLSTGNIIVGVGNLPPVTTDDNAVVVINTPKTINVMLNDYDPDTASALTLISVTNPAHGTTDVNSNSVVYTPGTDYTGADTFNYTVQDIDGKSSIGIVNVTVVLDPNNMPPVAIDDSLLVTAGQSIVLLPLLNDYDSDGHDLAIESFTQASQGVVSNNGNGTLTYEPHSGASGTDSFTYTINDGNGATDTGTFTINYLTGSVVLNYSHLRIIFITRLKSLNAYINEVEFLDNSVALDLSPASRTVEGDVATVANMEDGQLNTHASLKQTPSVVQYVFPEGQTVRPDQFRINGDSGNRSVTHFQIQGSEDGENWIQLTDAQTATNGSWQTYDIFEPTVINQSPLVVCSSDIVLTFPNNSSTLSSTVSDDGLPGGGITSLWTQESGPVGANFADANQLSTAVTFPASGVYVIRLTADDGELSSYDEIIITVNSPAQQLPTADFAFLPASGQAPLQVSFDASSSHDPDGTISSYDWDFGDGTTASGLTPAHTFQSAGTYTVELVVTDNDSQTDSITYDITVQSVSSGPGRTISLNFGNNTLSASESAGVIASFNWNNVSSSQADLLDMNGNPTGASALITDGGNKYNTDDNPSINGDYKMMSSYAGNISASGVVQITLTNLPAEFHGGFDVYAFFGAKDSGGSVFTPSYTIGSTTYVIKDNSPTWDGSHDLSSATTSGDAINGNNFVHFEGISGNKVTIEVRSNGGERRHGINGLQLVAFSTINVAPTVNISSGSYIILPQSLFLQGTVSDDGIPGTGISATWSQVSGPGVVTFADATALQTTASFSIEGDYVLRLTADDGEQTQYSEVSVSALANPTEDALVAYLGAGLASRLDGGLELSDGTILLCGASDDLSWVPSGVIKIQASNPNGVLSHSSGDVSFILRLSKDMSQVIQVFHLPAGAAGNVQRIRATNFPSQVTGDLYLSGLTNNGYFIARLNNNFVNGTPSDFEWVLPVTADTLHKENQAWDVTSDGSVIYQSGARDNNQVWFVDADGIPGVVPQLRASHLVNGIRTQGIGASLPAATESYIQFPSDVASWSESDRTTVLDDGNGNKKMGMWPYDIFLTTTIDTGDPVRLVPDNGKTFGYTGYRSAGTYEIGSIVVDRRTNDFYIGFNIQSIFYDPYKNSGAGGEQPDFEPALIAYNGDGSLKWWSRMYTEWEDADNDNIPDFSGNVYSAGDETFHSAPDQYVDGLEIDYSDSLVNGGTLVVNARCHGNQTSNFWSGDEIAARPGAIGFHNRFTGTEGNIHITWIGKLALGDGTLQAATYLAGFWRKGLGNWPASPYADPNLDGWPNHNAGWPNLTTTKATPNALRVDTQGRVYIVGNGPRMVTTRTAWQKLPKRLGGNNPVVDEGVSPWSAFARAFSSDLSTLAYSTALTGQWTYPSGDTTQDPEGASNTILRGVIPVGDGLMLAIGYAEGDSGPYVTKGNPIPVNNVPFWGEETPVGQTALFGRFMLPGGSLPDDTFFGGWIAGAQFGLSSSDQGQTDDPDSDGLANLLEYTIATNPSLSDSTNLFTVSVVGNEFSFQFHLSDDAPDVSYQIEWTNDLNGTWNIVDEGQIQIISNEGSSSVYDARVPVSGMTRIYFRLRVFLNPVSD